MTERTQTTGVLRCAIHALALARAGAPVVTLAYLVALTLSACIPVVVAWVTKGILDGLSGDDTSSSVLALAATLAALGLLAAWSPHAQTYLHNQLDRKVGLLTLQRLYGAVNRLQGLARFESPAFLDRLRLAQQSTAGIPSMIVQTLFGMAGNAVTIAGFLASLFVISPTIVAAILLGSVPALAGEMILARRRAGMLWRITPTQRRELMHAMLLTDVPAAREIRLFGIGGFLLGRIRADRVSANRAQQAVDRRELVLQVLLGALSAGIAGAALFWAVAAAHAGRLTAGDVVLFVAAVAGVQTTLVSMIQSLALAQQNLILFGHYVDVVAAPDDLPVPADPRPLPTLTGAVELRDVWFRYAPDLPWVLQGVTLRIPFGSSLGLVGVNGAGKSTLVALLCRFYDPTRGHILWDGVDLRDVDPRELRSRIGAVFQDFMRYDLDAAENIGVGNLDRIGDRARIEAAAAQAGVDTALRALPRGYDTQLTRVLLGIEDLDDASTGVPLSGGQWQRLALARAFMRDGSDLLILDEPSSGLDAQAEFDIHQGLEATRVGRTSVLVSHRLAALRGADRIVVLEGGRITENGPHDELATAGGTYARLFDLQARGYAEERDADPVAAGRRGVGRA